MAQPEDYEESEACIDAMRESGRIAFHEGRYKDGYGKFTASVLTHAILWFREEGVTFTRPAGELTPSELVIGLAHAANAVLRERGDEASNKLAAATWMFEAVAELRIALDEPVPMKVDAVADKVAELVTRSIMLGQIDMIMSAIRIGWLDKLAEHEIDRARRRAGAAATNEKRASVRDQALAEAIRIVGMNPTLSHEDIAVKVRESLRLSTTIKTITDWVRDWRRRDFLPRQKVPGR